MKHTLKTLFATLLLPLLFVGCQDPVEEPTPTITIEAEVAAPVEGGSVTLAYSLENPVEGATLSVENISAQWIHNFAVTQEQVEFVAEENLALGATSREATFELTYGGKSLSLVTVRQGTVDGTFAIEVHKVTPETIEYTVTPSNPSMTYLVNVAPKSFIEENGGLEEYAIVEADYFRKSFYGDVLDKYLQVGTVTNTITIAGAPEEPMWLWVAGVVRAADQERTPIVVAEPAYHEFQFLPYPILSLQSYSHHLESTEGGTFTLRYALENPFEAGELKVEIADDGQSWVRNVAINQSDRTITFDYDENPYSIERKATLYVRYDYSEICEFVLTQVANLGTQDINFEISVDEVHYDRVVVGCVPDNNEVEYVLGAIAKRDFESSSHNSDPTKIPELDLVASYPTFQILSGPQSGITLHNTAISYDTNWYIYAYAINPAHDAAISEVKMVEAVLVEDRPYFVWEDERVTSTEYSNTISVDNTQQTVTVKYAVANSHPTGVVVVEEPYDDILIKDGSGKRVVLDQQAQTVTFTVSANTTKRARTTYVYLKYFSSESDDYSDANTSLKISQSK
jgi:hypothetical protein